MRICPKCGQNFSDVTTFCAVCGVALPKTSFKTASQRTTTTPWNDSKLECEVVENESKNESEENASKVDTSQNGKSDGDNFEFTANPASDFVYTQSNGQITITQLKNGEMEGVVRVPSQIDHLPVTVIGGTPQEWVAGKVEPLGAFQVCNRLTEIILPNSVIQIGELAFPGDEHLTIYAQKGSYAWKYAKDRGLQWSEPISRFSPQTSESMSLWRRLFKWR